MPLLSLAPLILSISSCPPQDVAAPREQPDPWIVRSQSATGAWAGDASVGPIGVTALLLLAFAGDGNERTRGLFAHTVTRATDWLLAQQDAASGCFGATDRLPLVEERALLEHAWATLAVSELTILGRSWPEGTAARDRAVDALLSSQRDDGSFGTARATGWATYALVSAREGGSRVALEAMWAARLALGRQVATEGDPAHLDAGKVALRCLIGRMVPNLEGERSVDVDADSALGRVVAVPDLWPALDPESRMLVCFAAYKWGGAVWERVSKDVKREVLGRTIRIDGENHGGFPAERGFGPERATAFSVLTLEAYFRYGRVLGMR